MNKNIIALGMLCTSASTIAAAAPARAELGLGQNSIGPSVAFGGGQSVFGIDSKFGISDNFSLRPFVYFPTVGTQYGAALTYDFNSVRYVRSPITPFVGASVAVDTFGGSNITTTSLVGGADLALNESVQLKGQVVVPLNTDQGQITTVTLGAGFRF